MKKTGFVLMTAALIAALISGATTAAHAEQRPAARGLRAALQALQSAKDLASFEAAYHSIPAALESLTATVDERNDMCLVLNTMHLDFLQRIETMISTPGALRNIGDCHHQLLTRLALHRANSTVCGNEDVPRLPFRAQELPANPDYYVFMGLQTKEVVLTFDDGPNPYTSRRIMDILEKAGVRGVFFNTGRNAALYPEISREVVARGHRLGSHSYFHTVSMGCKLNRGKMVQSDVLNEILKGHVSVTMAAGGASPFFRFPNGSMTPTLKKNAMELGLSVWDWAIDSNDWSFTAPKAGQPSPKNLILRNIDDELKQRKGRGIILFHDIWEQTAQSLPAVLQYLKDNGYTVVLPAMPADAAAWPSEQLKPVAKEIAALLTVDPNQNLLLAGRLPFLTPDPESMPDTYSLETPADETCGAGLERFVFDFYGADARHGRTEDTTTFLWNDLTRVKMTSVAGFTTTNVHTKGLHVTVADASLPDECRRDGVRSLEIIMPKAISSPPMSGAVKGASWNFAPYPYLRIRCH